MPSARPHLASWERRLIAGTLDTFVIFVGLAITFAVTETLGLSFTSVVAIAPAAYVAYQSASLLTPHIGLGRMVAGILVVSIRNHGQITKIQAIGRPLVRIVLIAAAIFVGAGIRREWLVALPLIVELIMIAHTPWRQSVADFLAGTIVVNSPPPQPHRAPAMPMYSSTDKEFGPPPK